MTIQLCYQLKLIVSELLVVKMVRTQSTTLTNEAGYQAIVNKIMFNIEKIPRKVITDLFTVHKEGTRHILQGGGLRANAEKALISNIEYHGNGISEKKIISMSPVTYFFEFGVEEHDIGRVLSDGKTEPMTKTNGTLGEWMDNHSMNAVFGFTVGSAGSILDKRNPLLFMGKGYEKAWQQSPSIVNKYLQQV